MIARITVTLKPGVLDTQGRAVHDALKTLDQATIDGVRIGKYIEVKLDETDIMKARTAVKEMCDKILANPVIEDYSIEMDSEG